jgi:electron transfer flavoprotein alpha subunit
MRALVIAEPINGKLAPSTLSAISAAQQVSKEIDLFIAGQECQELAQEISESSPLNKILLVNKESLNYYTAEVLGEAVASIGKAYTHIMAPATTFGKNFLPRVAALLDVAQISDIIEIIDSNTFVRPVYAGNALTTVVSQDSIKVMSVRPTHFPAVTPEGGKAIIEFVNYIFSGRNATLIEHNNPPLARPDLNSARVVVAGGRGMQSAENFKILEELADLLEGAIGASRAAVDAGYVPNDYQVGQTGKIVAPELYIAVGISGAIQHLAGMKESQIIVAINKDPDAPIFQVADYGLVGDLFEIIPQITLKIKQIKLSA